MLAHAGSCCTPRRTQKRCFRGATAATPSPAVATSATAATAAKIAGTWLPAQHCLRFDRRSRHYPGLNDGNAQDSRVSFPLNNVRALWPSASIVLRMRARFEYWLNCGLRSCPYVVCYLSICPLNNRYCRLYGLDVGGKGCVGLGRCFSMARTYVVTPICCPSRSAYLSGKYTHNHRTLQNSQTQGCASDFWVRSIEPRAYPAYLAAAGYRTAFFGKYLNAYGTNPSSPMSHVPPGWHKVLCPFPGRIALLWACANVVTL